MAQVSNPQSFLGERDCVSTIFAKVCHYLGLCVSPVARIISAPVLSGGGWPDTPVLVSCHKRWGGGSRTPGCHPTSWSTRNYGSRGNICTPLEERGGKEAGEEGGVQLNFKLMSKTRLGK